MTPRQRHARQVATAVLGLDVGDIVQVRRRFYAAVTHIQERRRWGDRVYWLVYLRPICTRDGRPYQWNPDRKDGPVIESDIETTTRVAQEHLEQVYRPDAEPARWHARHRHFVPKT